MENHERQYGEPEALRRRQQARLNIERLLRDLANTPGLIIDKRKRGFEIATAGGLTRQAAARLVDRLIGKPRRAFTRIHSVGRIA